MPDWARDVERTLERETTRTQTFLNRMVFAGVPIPPLVVEIGA
jgi:hypothetical protein